MSRPDIAVCGAGLAGLATAYYLALNRRIPPSRIVLIDRLMPMSLTTSKSGENFRELWPQSCITALMRRSLDLMQTLADEHADVFKLRYSGYDFVSESTERGAMTSWTLRDAGMHGIRLDNDAQRIRSEKPYLADSIRQVLHVERAGAIDVQALGQLLLRQARRAGVEFRRATIRVIRRIGDARFELDLDADDGRSQLVVKNVVLAAGPFVAELAAMVGIDLPVENIVQRKIVIPDPASIIPRDMPFTIYADPQRLSWSDEDRALIAQETDYRWLLDELPAGLHIKPEGGGQIKLGWAFNRVTETPVWDIDDDPGFPNVVIRGASRFIPGLAEYVDTLPTPVVQFAGYYTRTRENWPIIGPLDDGVYAVAALSGYGTMAACGAGELCADWIAGNAAQSYAGHFHPDRYNEPSIRAEIANLASDGQL